MSAERDGTEWGEQDFTNARLQAWEEFQEAKARAEKERQAVWVASEAQRQASSPAAACEARTARHEAERRLFSADADFTHAAAMLQQAWAEADSPEAGE